MQQNFSIIILTQIKSCLNFQHAQSLIEAKAKLKNQGGVKYEPCKMESNEGNGDIAESYQPPF
jgi:hypothetical protein